MNKEIVDLLWKTYREYCAKRMKTANGHFGSVHDFLAWIEAELKDSNKW